AAGRRGAAPLVVAENAARVSAAALSVFHVGDAGGARADLEDRSGGRADRTEQRRGISARRLFPVLRHRQHPRLYGELRRRGARGRGLRDPAARAIPDAVAGMSALEVNIVRKAYRSERGELVAIEGLELAVPEGQFACIIGPSGCGKTTLLSIIAGLDRDYIGAVRRGGVHLGMVFQTPRLMPWLSARENV